MSLLFAIIKLSLKNLWAHKLRSFLTTLGIMIGVASVIAMMAIGMGAQEAMVNSIRGFGTNTLTLHPNFRQERGAASASFEKITLEDCQAVFNEVPEIQHLSPDITKSVQVKLGNQNTRTQAQGVASCFLPIRNYKMEFGRFFTQSEELGSRKVCVLGAKVVEELYGKSSEAVVGTEVKIDGTAYTVLGTMHAKGDSGFFNPDDVLLVPYTTAMRRMVGVDYVNMVDIKVFREDMLEEGIRGITRVMRKRHRLTPEKEDDFMVFSSKDALQTLQAMGAVMTLMLAGIASISLLVGGIGIMNIMLVTVTERTREIGIRKALGAKRRDIMRQFLIESIVISLLGGGMGVAIGISTAVIISAFDVLNAQVSPAAIFLSLGVCLFIGIFFGIYPARKAARLDPIEALRYE